MGQPRSYLEPLRATAVRLAVAARARLRVKADARLMSASLLVEPAITEILDRIAPRYAGLDGRQ
jgi:hypothetical protein